MGNPFHTYMGLMERTTQYAHMFLHNDPVVVGYQVHGELTVDDAYGNPAASGVGGLGVFPLFEVARGVTYRAPSLLRKGWGQVEENRRGTTHAIFQWTDVLVGGVGAPATDPDELWFFMRVQENRNGIGLLTVPGPLPVLGPIFCVPPASVMALPKPTFTLQGIAPSAVAGVAAGAVPPFDEDLTSAAPRPLYVVMPFPMTVFTIENLDGANTLLVSFGPDQLMQAIAPGGNVSLSSGATKALVLACPNAGGCPYSIHGVLGRG